MNDRGENTFHLRNKQKYLKVEILNYAFMQKDIFEILHQISRDERKFIAREYKMIK